MKKFTLALAMSALTVLGAGNVFAQSEPFRYSDMTNYYIIELDDETKSTIPKSDIVADYSVDDNLNFWYPWADEGTGKNTYEFNVAAGPNSNGVPGAFQDLSVSTVGWSGFGYVTKAPGKDLAKIDNSYYFHIALKSQTTGSLILGFACGKKGEEGKICIGSKPFEDAGKYYDPIDDFDRDGEWYSIDIPVSLITRAGAVFRDGNTENTFFMLNGGKTGENICYDSVFFYQKKSDVNSMDDVTADDVQVVVGANTITVMGSNGIELYDVSGKLVKATENSVVGIEGLSSGLYIVKTGNVTKKVMIK